MHTVTLKLETPAWQEKELGKRFAVMCRIHNILVKHAIELLYKLEHDADYQNLLAAYRELHNKNSLAKDERERVKELSGQMQDIRKNIGLTEYGLQAYIKTCGKRYKKSVSSEQVQKEATRVYRGVEKVLFGNGKRLHYKKQRDFTCISGKSNKNGVRFYPERHAVTWNGMEIRCKYPKNKNAFSYTMESLGHGISYCDVKREMFPNGWHYYVAICLKSDPPPRKGMSAGNGVTGIDIGTSAIAAVSDNSVLLQELAEGSRKYEKQMRKLQRSIGRSLRNANPERFNPDGTVKKGIRKKWNLPKTCRKNKNRLASLYRKRSAFILQSHRELLNRMLPESNAFVLEDMSFAALARRKKTLERQAKPSIINGKAVYKYKRKKRFGSSMARHAPALFVKELKEKCRRYGKQLYKTDTRSFKASQYSHVTGGFTKTTLKERWKVIDGHKVQRDLYSAFLLQNTESSLQHADQEKCMQNFNRFLQMHDICIRNMMEQGTTMKQCFGF